MKDTIRGRNPLIYPTLTPAQASTQFRFRDRGPVDGSLYVLHPIDTREYLLPARANVDIAREKFAKFSTILSSIGAKSLTVLSAQLRSQAASAGVSAPLPQAAAQLGLNVSFNSSSQVDRATVRQYERRRRAQFGIPEDLTPWLEGEPELLGVVRERLEHGLLQGSVTFSSIETLAIAAEVTASVAKQKIAVGGEYERLIGANWSFEVEFWPLDEG